MNKEKLEKTTSAEFTQFLEDKGALGVFIDRYSASWGEPKLEHLAPSHYVSIPFHWGATGTPCYNYWFTLHKAWVDQVCNGNMKKDAHYEEITSETESVTTEVDMVNHPPHYQLSCGKQAIDIIRASMTEEQFIGYCMGNALKYRLRAGNKGDVVEDIAKANWYTSQIS